MRFITSVFVTALLIFAAGLYLPWWSIVPASFIVALAIPLRPLYGFLSGFLGLFFCYAIIAFLRNSSNDGILSERIASMFYLGGSAFLLILVTCILFGLVSGFAALTGSYLTYRRISVRDSSN